ncbi:hypothetical protein [Pilimelia columellifera]
MPSLRAPAAAVAVLVTFAGLAGGCASGPGAPAWATAVCRAMSPWRAQIGQLTRTTQEQMTARTTPPQARENLTRLLGGAHDASDAAWRGVVRAGTPDVDNGDLVARRFQATLAAVRDAYGGARDTVSVLPTTEAEPFYDGVAAAMTTLQREYDAGVLDTSRLESAELKRAFEQVPDCQ